MGKITYETCDACAGEGRMPDGSTGKVLRSEREKAGITQAVVAEAMGISTSYVSDLEADNRDWSHELVVRYRLAVLKAVAR